MLNSIHTAAPMKFTIRTVAAVLDSFRQSDAVTLRTSVEKFVPSKASVPLNHSHNNNKLTQYLVKGRSAYDFLFDFNRNCASILYIFEI